MHFGTIRPIRRSKYRPDVAYGGGRGPGAPILIWCPTGDSVLVRSFSSPLHYPAVAGRRLLLSASPSDARPRHFATCDDPYDLPTLVPPSDYN